MELDRIRNEIDITDSRILELFLKRMELVKAVAKSKADKGLPTVDNKREGYILRRVSSESGDMEKYTQRLFTTIFELSRLYQENLASRSLCIDDSIQKTC